MRALRILQVFVVVACVLLAFHAAPAFAQATPPGGPPTSPGQVTPPPNPIDSGALVNGKAHFDSVRTQFLSAAQHWETTLGHYATRLFWLLAFIELIWTSVKLVLRGADLQEWVTELVKYVLFIGFFAALLMYGAQWATLIVNSFQIAASNAASAGGYNAAGVSPSDIFASGINIAAQIDEKASWYELGKEVGALVIVLLFAAIAAMIVLAWIETYFVIFASIIFTGFGGSRFTSDYAKRMLMLAVTAGAKLFVLLLVASLLQTMAQNWANAFSAGTDASVLSLLGLCALGAFLCVRIPSLISSISSGQVASSSGLIAAAATMATAAAGLGVAAKGLQSAGKSLQKGVQGAHGAGMAMSAASSLASAQGAGGPGGIRGAMAHVGRTTANLGKSGVQNIGGPMSGRSAFSARSANGGQGNLGSRMADSMTAKKAELTKPSAPSGGGNSPSGGGGGGAPSADAAGTGSISGAGADASAPGPATAGEGGGSAPSSAGGSSGDQETKTFASGNSAEGMSSADASMQNAVNKAADQLASNPVAQAMGMSGGPGSVTATVTRGESQESKPTAERAESAAGRADSAASRATTAAEQSRMGAGSSGGGTGGTPRNESPQGREKRSEFRDALRHFGNRIKSHNTGE